MHKIITKETKKTIRIYNSLSKKKEIFISNISGHVGIYVCGATVYDQLHIGNCRTFISLDLIIRYFIFSGYKVRYIRNITDIGHLEGEIPTSLDKLTKNKNIGYIDPMESAQKYAYDLHRILVKFNAIFPNIEPVASGHVIEQIEIIKTLLKKGFAYEANGSIYFNINSYIHKYKYGLLSHNIFEKNKILKKIRQKKNPKDFALWKKSDKDRIMQWNSPWSKGVPGWHLECTAMSIKYLSEVFDIHAGGIDLKFPHHECDIAQSIGFHGKIPSHYWIHSNMLTLNKKKMSKSKGNIIIPSDIFNRYSYDVIRFFFLQTHYRSILSFSNKALLSAEKSYNRLVNSFLKLKNISINYRNKSISTLDIITWRQKCYDAMNDDFNSPRLIAYLFKAMNWIQLLIEEKEYLTYFDLKLLEKTMKSFFSEVLGFTFIIKKETSKIKKLLNLLLSIRSKARKDKNWVLADKIRKELISLGYIFHDSKN